MTHIRKQTTSLSLLAYREGVVISVCKGCDAKHLIADNIGWSGVDMNSQKNIEDYLKNQGTEVNRVSTEVFELEKVLNFDTKGGAILGEGGRPVLE